MIVDVNNNDRDIYGHCGFLFLNSATELKFSCTLRSILSVNSETTSKFFLVDAVLLICT